MHNCTTCCFRSSTVSSRWLQLVATPVKYNHNSIENISTLSNRVTVVLIASNLDVGLSHNSRGLYISKGGDILLRVVALERALAHCRLYPDNVSLYSLSRAYRH